MAALSSSGWIPSVTSTWWAFSLSTRRMAMSMCNGTMVLWWNSSAMAHDIEMAFWASDEKGKSPPAGKLAPPGSFATAALRSTRVFPLVPKSLAILCSFWWRPTSRCSVPTAGWPRRRASSRAARMDRTASSTKRSNNVCLPGTRQMVFRRPALAGRSFETLVPRASRLVEPCRGNETSNRLSFVGGGIREPS